MKKVRMLLRVSSNQQLEPDGDLSVQREIVKEFKTKFDLKISSSAINLYLKGKVKTPYKGRFMFYYATDEEVKKYLEDGKVS